MSNLEKTNPLARLEKIWRITERVALLSALMVITGTLGYVSVHIL